VEQIFDTAEEAIDESIQENVTTYCEDTPDNQEFLEQKCGDYVENYDEIEYWSTVDEDGSEWRVHIKIEKHP
jgi:hypothetical protein